MGFQGGGVKRFLQLQDVNAPTGFAGEAFRLPKVNAGETELAFGNPGSLNLNNTLIVDPDGFGDHTTIQAAIDAAVSPSTTNPWTVLIASGSYSESLTLRSSVHLKGIAEGTVRITTGAQINSVANCTLEHLTILGAGLTLLNVTADTFRVIRCRIGNSGGSINSMVAQRGEFWNNVFFNLNIDVQGSAFGSGEEPKFFSCFWRNDNPNTSPLINSTSGGHSFWQGCFFYQVVGALWMDLGSGHAFDSCRFFFTQIFGGQSRISVACKFTGCEFRCFGNSSTIVPMRLQSGARFVGSTILHTSSINSATPGAIAIETLGKGTAGTVTHGPIVFSGCDVFTDARQMPIIMLWSTLVAGEDAYPLVITGSSLRAVSTAAETSVVKPGTAPIFGTHADGFSGRVTVALSGNQYQGRQNTMPQPASGGGEVRWRGTDFRTVIFPVALGVGTGAAATVENKPVQELNLATETALVSGRFNPPAGALADLLLMLSCEHPDGTQEDTFIDTDGANLQGHMSNSGGSWLSQSGTATIQSNELEMDARVGPAEIIYTYSVTSADGYMTIERTSVSTAGTVTSGLLFRWADNNNYWYLVIRNPGIGQAGIQLAKVVGGVETVALIVDGFTGVTRLSVSFHGDVIRVWINDYVVGEIRDSDLQANVSVGVFGKIDTLETFDNFMFHPGGALDLTVSGAGGMTGQRGTLGFIVPFTGIPVIHRVLTLQDISGIIESSSKDGVNEIFWGAEVELDALNGLTSAYIHGVLARWLPVSQNEYPESQHDPLTGLIYR